MIIKEINNKKIWEDFVFNFEKRTFLVSWLWGEIRKSMGDKVYRKGVWVNGELVALFFALKVKARKGNFLLLNHNPLIKKYSEDILIKILNEIKRIGREEKVSFLRMAPLWEENSLEDSFFEKKGFIISPSLVFPEKSWELSLKENEFEILSNMRKNTRYMIRRSQRKGDFKIIKSKEASDLEKFYRIYKKTSLRGKFKPFSFEYIKKEFEFFSEKNQSLLFLAEQKGKCLAGAIILFWQNIAFYHHGASINSDSKLSPSHLIQWEAIKEAKDRGCEKYNFWIISPGENSKHPWAGLTFFKKGFGGNEINYTKAKDLPLSCRYWLTFILEKRKKIRRGF